MNSKNSDKTMNLTCAVMQPTYIPWLGYFDLIDRVDKFVFLDNVQLEKNSWQLRNRIKTAQGELFLSISRKKNKGKELCLIKDVKINDETRWRKNHTKSIEIAYKKAEYFDLVYPFIESQINSITNNLSRFNMNLIKKISEKIGIKTEFLISSEIPNIVGKKEYRVVEICKALKSQTYISPKGAAVYIEKNEPGGEFSKQNIILHYQDYSHPHYRQLYGDFLPYLSIIDLLFNEGFDKSLQIIRSGRVQSIRSN